MWRKDLKVYIFFENMDKLPPPRPPDICQRQTRTALNVEMWSRTRSRLQPMRMRLRTRHRPTNHLLWAQRGAQSQLVPSQRRAQLRLTRPPARVTSPTPQMTRPPAALSIRLLPPRWWTWRPTSLLVRQHEKDEWYLATSWNTLCVFTVHCDVCLSQNRWIWGLRLHSEE